MMPRTQAEASDEYIARARPDARAVLHKIRKVIRKAAPDAEETIIYRMPAFRRHGMLIYFAAFKNHIGIFPPIKGDKALEKALQRYRGPKGNLQFPLDKPIPYALVERIATLRAKQDDTKAAKSKKRP